MLDEMGLRALWANEKSEETFGVTFALDTKYRKPVPYNTNLIGKGIIIKNTSKFFVTEASIMDKFGNILANGTIKYIKLDVNQIKEGISVHDEMCYLVEDDVKEINFEK